MKVGFASGAINRRCTCGVGNWEGCNGMGAWVEDASVNGASERNASRGKHASG